MKSLLSCAVCAIAPALLVPALAFAQGAPPPSDPGAPVAQPPGGGPTVSTPGAPSAGPAPDQASNKLPVPQEEPEALIWRGTTFTWTSIPAKTSKLTSPASVQR